MLRLFCWCTPSVTAPCLNQYNSSAPAMTNDTLCCWHAARTPSQELSLQPHDCAGDISPHLNIFSAGLWCQAESMCLPLLQHYFPPLSPITDRSALTALSRGGVHPAISHPSQHFVVSLCSQAVKRVAVSLFCICVTHSDREMPPASNCFGNTN